MMSRLIRAARAVETDVVVFPSSVATSRIFTGNAVMPSGSKVSMTVAMAWRKSSWAWGSAASSG